MEPTVYDGLGRSLRILPVTSHHVLTLDDDLACLSVRKDAVLVVADSALHRAYDTSGRSETGKSRSVRADDRSSFRKTISLERRHTDSAEISL